MTKAPTPAIIKKTREKAGLTQTQAAEILGRPLRTWQCWECPAGKSSHRAMSANLWELFLLKLSQHAA